MLDISKKYGRLKILSKAPSGKNWVARWNCLCDCGKAKTVFESSLKSGNTQSCGCLQKEKLKLVSAGNRVHGESDGITRSPEYMAWSSMISRCYNPSHKSYARYGGRGIIVWPAWKESYTAFLKDMGRRPSMRHSLGRIDNDGHYCPENVRWETSVQQNRNVRSNRYIEYGGQLKTVAEWIEISGLSPSTFRGRVKKGWPLDKIFNTPQMRAKHE